jgi:hypothetical protein
MRRGGVTAARNSGVSMLDIQKHGRWKSLVVFSYVGSSKANQVRVTEAFMSGNGCYGTSGEKAEEGRGVNLQPVLVGAPETASTLAAVAAAGITEALIKGNCSSVSEPPSGTDSRVEPLSHDQDNPAQTRTASDVTESASTGATENGNDLADVTAAAPDIDMDPAGRVANAQVVPAISPRKPGIPSTPKTSSSKKRKRSQQRAKQSVGFGGPAVEAVQEGEMEDGSEAAEGSRSPPVAKRVSGSGSGKSRFKARKQLFSSSKKE